MAKRKADCHPDRWQSLGKMDDSVARLAGLIAYLEGNR